MGGLPAGAAGSGSPGGSGPPGGLATKSVASSWEGGSRSRKSASSATETPLILRMMSPSRSKPPAAGVPGSRRLTTIEPLGATSSPMPKLSPPV